MSVPRLRIVRAFNAGRLAKMSGKPDTAVPYDLETQDPVERLRVMAWLRGWRTTPGPRVPV